MMDETDYTAVVDAREIEAVRDALREELTLVVAVLARLVPSVRWDRPRDCQRMVRVELPTGFVDFAIPDGSRWMVDELSWETLGKLDGVDPEVRRRRLEAAIVLGDARGGRL